MAEKQLTGTARRLRREMTDPEKLLWVHLRGQRLGAKFLRQFPIGTAVADFACRTAKLVIELDGGHHAHDTGADASRTAMIESYGYRVIRFWNNDVVENIDGVLEEIQWILRLAANH